ncbi:hypothetical protein Ae406Ps2_5246 [Pseudonocardia sp. Ae406_Ps2]|nr:hypothetical protein Ae331Ps2_0714c [Pseudonocardia sp. Ae331_Ps2]OLM05246.1 hypothetical protein Ae406Ps2_5246 [Pseudonocardia sp. Ae406_Ps2]OLM09940.1 hypothetical protein Ae505Ps2_0061c [Pseudonocardia sp. Ae505_Ps2]OLM26814.1 hypothetical protein Ae706Ps2_5247 [Pseudonocardia sp. Ae706_Ps2]
MGPRRVPPHVRRAARARPTAFRGDDDHYGERGIRS